jgi:hypothetical protein
VEIMFGLSLDEWEFFRKTKLQGRKINSRIRNSKGRVRDNRCTLWTFHGIQYES